MGRQAIVFTVAALGAFATSACAQEVVRIGHVADVSGPVSYFGKDQENGTRMAVETLHARGIVIGGKKVRFELVAQDDQADPRQATSAAQKLVDAKVNGVIGHQTSGTTIPASRIYHTAGIPQISPSATNPQYTQQGFNTAFRVVANDRQLGRVLGQYAVKSMAARRIVIIDDRTAYGQGLAMEFTKGAHAAGGTIVGKEFTTDKATDFGAILTRAKAAKPDLIFYGGMSAVAGPMLRQMKQLGLGKIRFVGGDGICSDELGKLSGGAMADGQVVCAEAGGVQEGGKPALDKFKTAYKKRFGIDIQIYSPYCYDAVMAIADAMVKAGSAAPSRYLPFLAKGSYPGITGTIAFDRFGDIRNGTLTLYSFEAGRRKIIAVTQ